MVVKKTVILLFISYGGCPERNAAWGGLDELAQKSPTTCGAPTLFFLFFVCFFWGPPFNYLSSISVLLIFFCGLARSVLLFLSFHLFILFLFKICVGKFYVSVCMYGVPSSLSHTQTHTHMT